MPGGRGDDIKGQLGVIMRAALAQMGTVKDVVVQKSRAGKIQLDVAMLKRQRKEVLDALDEHIDVEAERARKVGRGIPDAPGSGGSGGDHAEDLDSGEESE